MGIRDPLLAEIARLRARVEELELREKTLKQAFAPPEYPKFPGQWGLTRQEEALVLCLYDHGVDNQYLPRERVHRSISETEPNGDYALLTGAVHRVRKKLQQYGIVIRSLRGCGYRIEPGSRPIVAKALAHVQALYGDNH